MPLLLLASMACFAVAGVAGGYLVAKQIKKSQGRDKE